MLAVAGQQALTAGAGSHSDLIPPAAPTWHPVVGPETNGSELNGPAIMKSCELCGATQTPMWRRGPSGKGSLCNACGVRWASRRRGNRRPVEETSVSMIKEAPTADEISTGGAVEQYYCKYCGLTWPLNFFKNRQQFGAHCSNCSRKRKSRTEVLLGGAPAEDIPTTSNQGLAAKNTSPTGPFLPHLNLRAAMPRKTPREELHFAPHKFGRPSGNAGDVDDLDEFSPPAKKSKSLPTLGDSSDEAYYDSDSETATSPYGPSANSLYRLLGAVENVLNEEREMATTLNQMQAVRAMIDSLDETRKSTLTHLEHTLMDQLEHLQHLITPSHIASVIEKERAQTEKNEAEAAPPTEATTVSSSGASASSSDQIPTSHPTEKAKVGEVSPRAPKLTTPEEDVREAQMLQTSILAVRSAEEHIDAAMGPHEQNYPHHAVMNGSGAPAAVAVEQVKSLPVALENAARELTAVFANATLLQMGSQSDIEAFKNCFVHVLNQSKAGINQDVATLFEALVALKSRQTQLGAGTFIDHVQLRALSNDLHALKQRVVQSSRAVQGMFVQLVSQFTEQIEAAKRIYQENAGNHVRLLDEVVRSRLAPALSHDVEQLKVELLQHINCVHANLAYLDSLVLTAE